MITYCENPVRLIALVAGSVRVLIPHTGQFVTVERAQLEEEALGEIQREIERLAMEAATARRWLRVNG